MSIMDNEFLPRSDNEFKKKDYILITQNDFLLKMKVFLNYFYNDLVGKMKVIKSYDDAINIINE